MILAKYLFSSTPKLYKRGNSLIQYWPEYVGMKYKFTK